MTKRKTKKVVVLLDADGEIKGFVPWSAQQVEFVSMWAMENGWSMKPVMDFTSAAIDGVDDGARWSNAKKATSKKSKAQG